MTTARQLQFPTSPLLVFVLLLGAVTGARAVDVSAYGVGKAQRFLQTNDTPEELIANPWTFTAIVQQTASNNVSGVRVQSPGSVSAVNLTNNGLQFTYAQFFSNKLTLDAAFPNGAYTNRMTNVHDGLKVVPLTLNFDFYPSIPTIANMADCQQIDPTIDFAIYWNDITPASGVTPLQIIISDGAGNVVIKSPDIGQPTALNYAATSFTIPGNTLQLGEIYNATLVVISMSDVNQVGYAGATGFAGYSRETAFFLRTLGPVDPPTLHIARATNTVLVTIDTEIGRTYVLQSNTNLLTSTNWTDLFTTNTVAGTNASYLDTNFPGVPRRFYRAYGQ
ncbi:MAG: hypothetical protein HY301_17585 [Verrucomicrobia bacterium]|nr:hypothetical protein [Verrucomicrobiota bacterium]